MLFLRISARVKEMIYVTAQMAISIKLVENGGYRSQLTLTRSKTYMHMHMHMHMYMYMYMYCNTCAAVPAERGGGRMCMRKRAVAARMHPKVPHRSGGVVLSSMGASRLRDCLLPSGARGRLARAQLPPPRAGDSRTSCISISHNALFTNAGAALQTRSAASSLSCVESRAPGTGGSLRVLGSLRSFVDGIRSRMFARVASCRHY